jgi:hypothetical protein
MAPHAVAVNSKLETWNLKLETPNPKPPSREANLPLKR